MTSQHERAIAEDRAKNLSPLGLAGPGSAVSFTCNGINAQWHPPLAPNGVFIRWRGGPGDVFDVPAADALSFAFDRMPSKIGGFAWVVPPSEEVLTEQYARGPSARHWDPRNESLVALLERAQLPPSKKGTKPRG